jgi:hypothetical protein
MAQLMQRTLAMRNRHALILLVASIVLLVLALPALKDGTPANAAAAPLLDASRDGISGSHHGNS